jgi:IS5 family transposase
MTDLSDVELEKQSIDIVSFKKFLDFSDHIPEHHSLMIHKKIIIGNSKKGKYLYSYKYNLIALV